MCVYHLLSFLFGYPAPWLTIITTVSPKRRKIQAKCLIVPSNLYFDTNCPQPLWKQSWNFILVNIVLTGINVGKEDFEMSPSMLLVHMFIVILF